MSEQQNISKYSDYQQKSKSQSLPKLYNKKNTNTRIYELKKSVFNDLNNNKFIPISSEQSTPMNNRSLADSSEDEIIQDQQDKQKNHSQQQQYYASSNFASHRVLPRKDFQKNLSFKDTSRILSTVNTTAVNPNFTPFVSERDRLGRLLNTNQSLPNVSFNVNNQSILSKDNNINNSKTSIKTNLPNINMKTMSEQREILKRNQEILQNIKQKDQILIQKGKKQKKQINILGQEQNAFKLCNLETDVRQNYQNLSQVLNNLKSKKSIDTLYNENEKSKEKMEILNSRFSYNGNPEESYQIETGNNKQSKKKIIQRKPNELVTKKLTNQPFIYETDKYCTVLKPRAPKAKILPEHNQNSKFNFKSQQSYNESKQITFELLRQQYLARLPQNPLKGVEIGQNRVNKEIQQAQAQVLKRSELSFKILDYNGDDMIEYEKKLKDLKSIAKKMRNNMLQEREAQIKKYNQQAIEEFKEDLERDKRNQESFQKHRF